MYVYIILQFYLLVSLRSIYSWQEWLYTVTFSDPTVSDPLSPEIALNEWTKVWVNYTTPTNLPKPRRGHSLVLVTVDEAHVTPYIGAGMEIYLLQPLLVTYGYIEHRQVNILYCLEAEIMMELMNTFPRHIMLKQSMERLNLLHMIKNQSILVWIHLVS